MFANCCECDKKFELKAETVEYVSECEAEGREIWGYLCDECNKAHDDEQMQ
jgi:uncharacterized protein YlaI